MARKEQEPDYSDPDNTRYHNKLFFGQMIFPNDRQAAQFRAFVWVISLLFIFGCLFPSIVIAVLIRATQVCGQ
jgi:ATP/ADP translocase